MARAVCAPEQQRTGVQRFLADLVDPALHVTGRQGKSRIQRLPEQAAEVGNLVHVHRRGEPVVLAAQLAEVQTGKLIGPPSTNRS